DSHRILQTLPSAEPHQPRGSNSGRGRASPNSIIASRGAVGTAGPRSCYEPVTCADHTAESHRPRGYICGPRASGPSSLPMPLERSMIDVAPPLALLLAACVEDGSTFSVLGEAPAAPPIRARIVVAVEDERAVPDRPMPLPVRVVVTASDGS